MILPFVNDRVAPLALQAVHFVCPNKDAATPVSPGSAAVIIKVTSPITITDVSVFADGGKITGAVQVQIRDYNNVLLGGTTITTASPIASSVWATELLESPITLGAGTYSISAFGNFTFDFGTFAPATYSGSGLVSAYRNYYPTGSPNQNLIIGGGGSPSCPASGAGWTALGDPKMRAINFGFIAVRKPSEYALSAKLIRMGFDLWRRRSIV